MTQITTPKSLGYRFPAEWELQEAVWFAWPVSEALWPGRLERVRKQLSQLYVLASRFQRVRVLCPADRQEELHTLMENAGGADNVEMFDYETDDVWMRDCGPLFLLSEGGDKLCIADWRYNAWGNKFPDQQKDDQVSGWIADQLGLRRFTFESVLEGGAIESNGQGQLLVTEAVLLNPNRNGEMSVSQMERKLCSGLCVDSVLWLKDGLSGDDTDGHIDNLARFFKTDGILIAEAADPSHPDYEALMENTRRLQDFRTPHGRPFASVQLPLPEPILKDGEPLAASYLNYVLLNGAVIMPTFQQPERDREALDILSDCFPEREVIGFDCSDIIHEGGALHCMSQHQPQLKESIQFRL